MSRRIVERELTDPVALCRPDGSLNPDAVGWTRRPLHDTSGIGRGLRSWGRNKRWEYWGVVTPTHLVSITVSDLDYAAVHGFWVHDRRIGRTIDRGAVGLPWSAQLPPSLGDGPAVARIQGLRIDLEEVGGGTRLRARAQGIAVDIHVASPDGHESLGVVVPWSRRRFQYTVKDVARPATGWVEYEGERTELVPGESWAVLDHGRGRWRYRVRWNWAAAAGRVGDRVVGLQLGAKWTDGTGSTENAVVVDGRLHKLSEELDWSYDWNRPLEPWRITGETADLEFTPFHDHASHTEFGVIGTHGHQVFGTFRGWVDASGERIEVDGIEGFAEEVRNRW